MVVVLPDPLGPKQAENLAAADLQVQRLERPDLLPAPKVAVDLGQVRVSNDHIRLHGGPFREHPPRHKEIKRVLGWLTSLYAAGIHSVRPRLGRIIHFRAAAPVLQAARHV